MPSIEENDEGWQSERVVSEEEDEARAEDFRNTVGKPREEFLEEEVEKAPPLEFDERWIQQFSGLAYLGYLEDEVHIPYHSFTVRTLTIGEKIKVTQMIKHLEDSIGYARAYRSAVAAAGLVYVDGEEFLVGSRKVDAINQKYQYVTDHWHDFVVDILYEKINELEGQVVEILKDMGVYEDKRQVAIVDTATTAGEPTKE